MNNVSNLLQILVFILVIGGPMIGAIARKLRAHAEQKRLSAERAKRQIEVIRTGRVEETPQPAAAVSTSAEQSRRVRLEELARQRQAQIEELRRRAAAQRQAGAAAPTAPRAPATPPTATRPAASARPSSAPASARPAPLSPPRAATPPSTSTRPPAVPMPTRPVSREALEARRRAEVSRRQVEAATRQEQAERARRDAARAVDAAKRKAAATPTPTRKPAGADWVSEMLHDPESLRRAVVLREILGPPVSLRDVDR